MGRFWHAEAGRGLLTVRDLQRVATAHDFTWTDRELTDMIHCFDSDGDGKLNLDDFRKIVCRCNMIRGKADVASIPARWASWGLKRVIEPAFFAKFDCARSLTVIS
ncbi:hypothetical protein GH714_018838 [Hevea brasiliensis]|uniref:EF-hand domain-containing protein n=1 Tax=Hevea brasiliensis TaxID=3981 RepID=A0A6A6LTQ3_HEVBR|nr:hypothetical protein GH714_018838 [Hevea brasiliensis]